jgi:hypothetical protein
MSTPLFPCRYALTSLDLRDNLVESLSELWVLAGLPKLRTLVLSTGYQDNPVCHRPNYRQAAIAALPGLQSLDGDLIKQPGVAQELRSLAPEAAPLKNVNWAQPERRFHPPPREQSTYECSGDVQRLQQGTRWQDQVRIGSAMPGAHSERVASGGFTSTSFTPTIDHALQGFYRRQQQRVAPEQGGGGEYSHGQQNRSLAGNVSEWQPGGEQEPGAWNMESAQWGVNVGTRVREEVIHTEGREKAAQYEERIGVLESRLLDLVDKVEKERSKGQASGVSLERGGFNTDEVDYREGAQIRAPKGGPEWGFLHGEVDSAEEAGEDRLSGWKRRKGEDEAVGTAPRKKEEARGVLRPRTLIHGHGGQEGKNKIVNTGAQRLFTLVNERKNKKGPAEVRAHQVVEAMLAPGPNGYYVVCSLLWNNRIEKAEAAGACGREEEQRRALREGKVESAFEGVHCSWFRGRYTGRSLLWKNKTVKMEKRRLLGLVTEQEGPLQWH